MTAWFLNDFSNCPQKVGILKEVSHERQIPAGTEGLSDRRKQEPDQGIGLAKADKRILLINRDSRVIMLPAYIKNIGLTVRKQNIPLVQIDGFIRGVIIKNVYTVVSGFPFALAR